VLDETHIGRAPAPSSIAVFHRRLPELMDLAGDVAKHVITLQDIKSIASDDEELDTLVNWPQWGPAMAQAWTPSTALSQRRTGPKKRCVE
jgi:hypothetical protein